MNVPRWVWWVSGLGVLAMLVCAGRDLSRYLISSSADRLGISNQPDSESDRWNLENVIAPNEPALTALLRQFYPGAKVTSVYRSDAVNAAVGGSDTSRHRYGLAIDYNVGADVRGAARFLKANASLMPIQARTVIAETTPVHLHIDFYAPGEVVAATKWRMEDGAENNFIVLV